LALVLVSPYVPRLGFGLGKPPSLGGLQHFPEFLLRIQREALYMPALYELLQDQVVGSQRALDFQLDFLPYQQLDRQLSSLDIVAPLVPISATFLVKELLQQFALLLIPCFHPNAYVTS
jgi:hypothetical protein